MDQEVVLSQESGKEHLPIPSIDLGGAKDETGCGDQTMATLCAFLREGKSVEESAKLAITAGTLQFNKVGITPVKKDELAKHAKF